MQDWLTGLDLKFYESKINLNWKPILKSIMEVGAKLPCKMKYIVKIDIPEPMRLHTPKSCPPRGQPLVYLTH